MAGAIASLVGTVQLKLKIERATTSDDEPTPIYLLDEVIQAVGANRKNVEDAVEALGHRLEFRSTVIKRKALKLIKYISQKGSIEFKKGLNTLTPAIRDLTHYRCAPDPFKGDIPWKRVQEYAREALEAVHAAPQQVLGGNDGAVMRGRGRIQGFGSTSASGGGLAFSSGGGSGYGNSGTMLGFGSDSSEPLGASSYSAGLSRDFSEFSKMMLGGSGGRTHRPLNSMDGDSWADDVEFGYHGQQNTRPQIVHATSADVSEMVSNEEKVINKFCTPSGVRVAPTAEECGKFISAISMKKGSTIASALEKKLDGTWQESLRALCLLEAMTSHEKAHCTMEEHVKHYFMEKPEYIKRTSQSAQQRVKQKAILVLSNLGLQDVSADAAPSGTHSTQTELNGGIDLLAIDDDGEEVTTDVKGNPIDLLAQTDTLSDNPSIPVSTGLDIAYAESTLTHAAEELEAVTQQQLTSESLDDLFGGMSLGVSEGTNKIMQPPPTAQVESSQQPSFDSILSVERTAASTGQREIRSASTDFEQDIFGDWTSSHTMQQQPALGATGQGSTHGQPQPPSMGDAMFGGLSALAPNSQSQQDNVSSAIANKNSEEQSNVASLLGSPPVAMPWTASPHASGDKDALSAWHAATSGISSIKREDAAFNFIQGAMADLKKK